MASLRVFLQEFNMVSIMALDFFADSLGTFFDGDAYGIIIGIEKLLRFVIIVVLRFMSQEYNMLSILVSVDVLVVS